MWWGITAVLAVTWLFGLTHATLEMWMEPEDKNIYYVKEGGPKFIQCIVKVDKGVKVNLTWTGPSIDASKPQRVSYIPHGDFDFVGNWLNITHFSNKTAGYYKCRALTSASSPNDLTQTIKLDKECDSERFNPPACDKNCSTYCKPGPDGAKGRNCDHMNGTCLSGCQEGYKMPYCTEEVDDPGDKDIGGIIGGVMGGVIGLLVVLIIIVLCVRRVRKRRKADAATPANVRQRQKEEEMVLIAEEKTDDKIEKPKADNDKREIESQKTYFENTISNLRDRIKELETEISRNNVKKHYTILFVT